MLERPTSALQRNKWLWHRNSPVQSESLEEEEAVVKAPGSGKPEIRFLLHHRFPVQTPKSPSQLIQESYQMPNVTPRWNLAAHINWQQTCLVPQHLPLLGPLPAFLPEMFL